MSEAAGFCKADTQGDLRRTRLRMSCWCPEYANALKPWERLADTALKARLTEKNGWMPYTLLYSTLTGDAKMDLKTKKTGRILSLKPLMTRLVADTSLEFMDGMEKIIAEDCDLVILNLSEIEFIDSRGLGAFVMLVKNKPEHVQIAICEPTEDVLTAFKLTRLDKIIPMYDNEESAIADFQQRSSAEAAALQEK